MNEDLRKPDLYLKYNGKTGEFKYWDKELTTEVKVDLSEMVVLFTKQSLAGGWDDNNNCGFYCNDIDNITKEELHLKSSKGGDVISGLYNDIKPNLPNQVKLCTNVIALMDGKIVKFFVKGITRYEFGEVFKTINIEKEKLSFDKIDARKNKAVEYFVPVFKKGAELTADEKKLRLDTIKEMTPVDNGPEEDLPF